MYSDDEASLTLSKWPFYLGDFLLVALSVVIAFFNDWRLDGIQVFACVLSVALGAALLVWPYVTEYLMRIREEKDDRSSEVRLLKKQLETTEAALLKQHERLNTLESKSNVQDQRHKLLAAAMDSKTQAKAPDKDALVKQIATLEKKLETLEQSVQQPSASVADVEPVVESESKKTDSEDSIEKPVELPKLVEKKKRSASKKPKTKALKTDAGTHDKPAEPVEMDLFPDDVSVSLGADLMMDDDLFDSGANESSDAKKAVNKTKRTKSGPTQSADSSAQAIAATVEVELMGIGNQPFIRGSGGGLNWETGVLMDFKEIGKWTWTAPPGFNEPIELQIYRNDKDPDKKGKYILNSGAMLEITPEF